MTSVFNEEGQSLQRDSQGGAHVRRRKRTLLFVAFLFIIGVAILVDSIALNSKSTDGEVSSHNEGQQTLAGTMEGKEEAKKNQSADLLGTSNDAISAGAINATEDLVPPLEVAAWDATASMDISMEPTEELSSSPTLMPVPTASPTTLELISAPTLATTIPPPDYKVPGCLPDRFDNEEMDLTVDPDVNFNKLFVGQFICSKPYNPRPNDPDKVPQRYQFGMTLDGDVVWQDTVEDETVVVFENPHPSQSTQDVYFSLTTNATMVYHHPKGGNPEGTTGTTIRMPPASLNHPMSHYPRCLASHDCPYFHLHADGVLVLNYIAGDGNGWQARNFLRAYGLK